jgi:NAD(P)-dependent dehydrogenase (short-subunit alcohol dehydrogenase family)
MENFQDRVAVITGAASGIGLAMARALADRGTRLVLADLDEPALARAEQSLSLAGAQVLAVPTDVTRLESVRSLAEAVLQRFGAVHLVCNNAGVMIMGEFTQATHKEWEFTMGVNFWGVVHGVETFVPILVEQRAGGHVLNTASMAGLVGMQWFSVYSASKFAVVGLTEALFRELRPHGIGVSVLCPMIVQTNLLENSLKLRAAYLGEECDIPAVDAGALAGGTVSAEDVARRALRGIERGDLYIMTHPEQRDFLRRRAARLDAAFEEDLG